MQFHCFHNKLIFEKQIIVTRQDGSPITGTNHSVVLHNTITAELPTPFTTPLYYWGKKTFYYKLNDQTFTLPDTGVVAVQVQIPENAIRADLHVSCNVFFPFFKYLEIGFYFSSFFPCKKDL